MELRIRHRLKVLPALAAAACLALAGSAPVAAQAQSGGLSGNWSAGPDAVGSSTYIGRVETPRAGQTINAGSNLLVAGWAADTTAAGWAGFDQLQVYNGDRTKGGTKLADGTVGLARPDVAQALGGNTATSGFTAVIPSSALSSLSGAAPLFVYLHTPNKGWWFSTINTNVSTPAALQFPNDPVLSIIRPQENAIITDKQVTSFYTIRGIALDRNPITDPGNQTMGSCGCGIGSVTVFMDAPRGALGAINMGNGNLGALYGVNNQTKATRVPVSSFSPVAREFGRQFDFAQWNLPINPATIAPGMHTLFVYARSSITGRESGPATVTFFIKDIPDNGRILSP